MTLFTFVTTVVTLQDLPIIDDGNSHNFFCALRLVVESQTPDQQKLFPQSARTKCVKASKGRSGDVNGGIAKWNELFIFEIPRKVTIYDEVWLTFSIAHLKFKFMVSIIYM